MQISPPLSTQPLHFTTPTFTTVKLDCGTLLHVIERETEVLQTISFFFSTGSAFDVHLGDSSFTASMLTKGTDRLGANEFSEELEGRGCSIQARCDRDTTTVMVAGLKEYYSDLTLLAAECLLKPRFDDNEIEITRQNWIANAMMDMADPDWLAMVASNTLAYHNHPYANLRNGSIANMKSLAKQHLLDAHQRILHSERCIIAAGPIPAKQLAETLNRHLSDLPKPLAPKQIATSTMQERTACLAVKEDAVQTSISIHIPCVTFSHPDYPAVQLITTVLGGYTLARLFMALREEKGYTYGAYAHNMVRQFGCSTVLQTSVGNDVTDDAVQTIADELDRLQSTLIDEEELENARQYLLGTFARSNETPQQSASLLWTMIQYKLPFDFFERLIARIQKFTPEDLLLVQERYFRTDAWCIGASGVASVVKPVLEKHSDKVLVFENTVME
ncbi:MAG: insulinase family protein [Ignavibacteria bacterium]|nr:insulinase family protein [Ignavibacteria bacterium]